MALAAGNGCTAHLTDGVNGPRCEGVPTTPVLTWDPVARRRRSTWSTSAGTRRSPTCSSRRRPSHRPATRCTPRRSTTSRTPTPTSRATSLSTGSSARAARSASAARRRCRPPAWPPTPSSSCRPPCRPSPLADVTTGELNFSWDDYYVTNRATTVGAPATRQGVQSAMQYRIQVDTDTAFQAPLVDERVVDQAAYTAFDRLYPEGKLLLAGPGDRLRRQRPHLVGAAARDQQVDHAARDRGARRRQPGRGHRPAALERAGVRRLLRRRGLQGRRPELLDRQPGRRRPTASRPAPTSPTPRCRRPARRTAGACASGTPHDNPGPWTTGRFFVKSTVPTLLSPAPARPSRPTRRCWPGSRWRVRPLPGERRRPRPAATSRRSRPPRRRTPSSTAAPPAPTRGRSPPSTATGSRSAPRARPSPWTPASRWCAAVEIQSPGGTGVGRHAHEHGPAVFDPADATLTYQWLRNGSQIFSATEPTYTLTAQDFAIGISLRVTGEACRLRRRDDGQQRHRRDGRRCPAGHQPADDHRDAAVRIEPCPSPPAPGRSPARPSSTSGYGPAHPSRERRAPTTRSPRQTPARTCPSRCWRPRPDSPTARRPHRPSSWRS